MISNKIIVKEFFMELVYLWVEDYKNIKKQGFNFSPRFRCDYDEITKELKVVDKEETGEFYPKNFFGDNINITAIVGENGSGKSSLLTKLTYQRIVIEKDEVFYSHKFKNIKSIQKIKPINQELYEIIHIDYDLIRIKPIDEDYFFSKKSPKLYTKAFERRSEHSSLFDIKKLEINIYSLIFKYKNIFKSEIFVFNPIKILLSENKVPSRDNNSERFSESNFMSFYKEKKINYEKLDNLKEVFEFLNKYDESSSILINDFEIIYKKNEETFLELIRIGYLQINLKDSLGREYFGLSQGERKLFTEMLMIYDEINNTEKKDIFLLLDEPDLTLHPQWQKNYIKELIKLLSTFPTKEFHVIITSHSSFILSDLPKENIIFLEKGKQVYPFDNGKQTFGANIHTLLSHGFL